MFCPSSVEVGIFINTAMTCSQTGGMTVGAEGVIKVGMVSAGLVVVVVVVCVFCVFCVFSVCVCVFSVCVCVFSVCVCLVCVFSVCVCV